jgi:hypothetical protein
MSEKHPHAKHGGNSCVECGGYIHMPEAQSTQKTSSGNLLHLDKDGYNVAYDISKSKVRGGPTGRHCQACGIIADDEEFTHHYGTKGHTNSAYASELENEAIRDRSRG